MANSKGYFSQLPPWAKGTVIVLGIVVMGGIGFAIYKGFKNAIERGRENKEGKESKDELNDAIAEGVRPTISEAEATAKVSSLQSAANDCDFWGTGATEIIAIIKSLKNKADYYLLNSTFGSKTWAECGTGSVTGSLTTLLTEELDSGQLQEVRTHLSSIGVNI